MGKERRHRPASTLEGRENQLISLAYDEAERQIRAGSASSQVMTHFLKMGSTREVREQRKLEQENMLLAAKVEQLQSGQRQEALFEEAIKVMRVYTGQEEAPQ